MITIMIALGMITVLTILVTVVLAIAVENGRWAVDLTVPIKNIDEVAQGNIKIHDCIFRSYFYMIMGIFHTLVMREEGEVRQEAHQKTLQQDLMQLQRRQ